MRKVQRAIDLVDAMYDQDADSRELRTLLWDLEDDPAFANVVSSHFYMNADALMDRIEEALGAAAGPAWHDIALGLARFLHLA